MLDFCDEGFCHCDQSVIDCISSNRPITKQDGNNQAITSQTGKTALNKCARLRVYIISVCFNILLTSSATDLLDDTYTSEMFNGTGETL